MRDRRAYARITCNLLPSDFKIPDNPKFDTFSYAQIKDISPVGVRLVVPKAVPLGDNLLLSLSLPTHAKPKYKNFRIVLSVTWISGSSKPGEFEFGGKFTGITEEAQNEIRNYCLAQDANP